MVRPQRADTIRYDTKRTIPDSGSNDSSTVLFLLLSYLMTASCLRLAHEKRGRKQNPRFMKKPPFFSLLAFLSDRPDEKEKEIIWNKFEDWKSWCNAEKTRKPEFRLRKKVCWDASLSCVGSKKLLLREKIERKFVSGCLSIIFWAFIFIFKSPKV